MTDITKLGIKIFLDGADLDAIRNAPSFVCGFTTNPSLIRRAGHTDYKAFCLAAIEAAHGLPISFEVFADDLPGMAAQAREIASWGENVYVKIPVMNTEGKPTGPVIADLSYSGIKVNVTAVMTVEQVLALTEPLQCGGPTPSIVSVFAGRIADTGGYAPALIRRAAAFTSADILWASPRQIGDVLAAQMAGAHIITLSTELVAKFSLWGRDLEDYSRETVEMFRRDALAAGYEIPLSGRAAA